MEYLWTYSDSNRNCIPENVGNPTDVSILNNNLIATKSLINQIENMNWQVNNFEITARKSFEVEQRSRQMNSQF